MMLRDSSETTTATEAQTHEEMQAGRDLWRPNLLLRAELNSKLDLFSMGMVAKD